MNLILIYEIIHTILILTLSHFPNHFNSPGYNFHVNWLILG